MKKTLILALALCAVPAFADHTKDHRGADAKSMDPKQAEMMKAWQAYATPGEAHKILAAQAGEWTYTSKMWMAPDAAPQESKGTASMKMVMGGRYLQSMVKGKAMGMNFEGMALTGYDNIKGKYETLWLDNMGTGVVHGTGSYDAEAKILKDSGEATCPMTENKTREFRNELKMIDKNNMLYSSFGPEHGGSGKEMKMMEITYKRK